MKASRIRPSFEAKASDEEIDRCLAVLEAKVSNEDELEFLIWQIGRIGGPEIYYRWAIDFMTDYIIELIRDGQLVRWDFDAFDLSHRGQQKTLIQSDWQMPDDWEYDVKRKLVNDVVDVFRRKCRLMVAELVQEFENARNVEKIDLVKETAIEMGVFVDRSEHLCHSFSIVAAKDAFSAYVAAMERLHH